MRIRIVAALSALVAVVAAFQLGIWWERTTFPHFEMYRLQNAVELQETPHDRGILPRGTPLYRYPGPGDVPQFIVFVNLGDLNQLTKYDAPPGRSQLIDPVDAYYSGEFSELLKHVDSRRESEMELDSVARNR